jgi:hypothetical protein
MTLVYSNLGTSGFYQEDEHGGSESYEDHHFDYEPDLSGAKPFFF